MSAKIQMSDNATASAGVVGTIASWSFSGTLSLLATIATLVVVGPKAWDQIRAWYDKYAPRVRAWWQSFRN